MHILGAGQFLVGTLGLWDISKALVRLLNHAWQIEPYLTDPLISIHSRLL